MNGNEEIKVEESLNEKAVKDLLSNQTIELKKYIDGMLPKYLEVRDSIIFSKLAEVIANQNQYIYSVTEQFNETIKRIEGLVEDAMGQIDVVKKEQKTDHDEIEALKVYASEEHTRKRIIKGIAIGLSIAVFVLPIIIWMFHKYLWK
jgi:hypothetical protein